MRKDKEKGAIVVEATIALTAFMFAIFTILSIVNICFIQAKVGIALNTAAKEISQYSYLYYALGIDNLEAKFNEGTSDSKQLAEDTIDGVGIMMSSLSNAASSAESGDFDTMISEIQNGATNVDSLVTKYADKLKNDPKGFILGMGKMATNELKEEGKVILAQILAKVFMEKNLMSTPNDDADAYLKSYGVVDGMDGLDFNYTTFLAYGTSNEIQLVCTYDVRVLQLLGIDFNFKIRQCSKTTAWGNGVSLISPSTTSSTSTTDNVWQLKSYTERGKQIVEKEKQSYTYTSSGQGFDAYNNAGGKNEFVTITSIDTTLSTYQDSSGIKNRLSTVYNAMDNSVSKLDSELEVQNQSGETVTVTSDPDTRTYQIVLVVPDDADLATVQAGVAAFEAQHPDATVVIKQGYGDAKVTETETEENNTDTEE